MARTLSLSSVIRYHTPIEDDDGDADDDEVAESMFVEGEGLSEIPSDLPGISISRGGSFMGTTTQAPSPSSAVMTVSLDAYLDPTRISYGSPADYEMLPRISSPDDTFPVFSPPPFDVKSFNFMSQFLYSSAFLKMQARESRVVDQNMLVPPNMNGGGSSSGSSVAAAQPFRRHRRMSSLNAVSWPNPNELSVSPRQRRMSTVASSGPQEADVIFATIISARTFFLIMSFDHRKMKIQQRRKGNHRDENRALQPQ